MSDQQLAGLTALFLLAFILTGHAVFALLIPAAALLIAFGKQA